MQLTIWRYLTTLFGGMLLAIAGWYFTFNKDVATKQDLKDSQAQTQSQLEDHSRQLNDIKNSILDLDVQTARMSERLGLERGQK